MFSRFESGRQACGRRRRWKIGRVRFETVRPTGRGKTQYTHRSSGQFEQDLLSTGLRDGARRHELRSSSAKEGYEVFVVASVEHRSCRPVRNGGGERHGVERTYPHHWAIEPEADALRQGHANAQTREGAGPNADANPVEAAQGPARLAQELFDERKHALPMSVQLLVQAHADHLVVLDESYRPLAGRGFYSQTTHTRSLAGMLRARDHNRSSL